MTYENEMLSTDQEFDFSQDSAVDIITAEWTITEAESRETESPNGHGVQHILTFVSDEFAYPVMVRQFVSYEPTDETKDVSWVKRSRGILKNIARAALGRPGYRLSELQGAKVIATTRDGGDGFATLTKFKAIAEQE